MDSNRRGDEVKTEPVREKPMKLGDLSFLLQYHLELAVQEAATTTSPSLKKGAEARSVEVRGLKDVLRTLGERAQTADRAVPVLEEMISGLQNTIDSSKDDNLKMIMDARMRLLERARDFIQNNQQNEDALKSPKFLEWLQTKEAQREIAQQKNGEARKKELTVAAEGSVEASRREAEAVREKILLSEVLEKGGSAMYMALPKEYDTNGGGGFVNKGDGRTQFDLYFASHVGSTFEHPLKINSLDNNYPGVKFQQRYINEAVTILPVEQDIYENREVVISGKKWGGLVSTTRVKNSREKVGRRGTMHSELVKGGTEEQAYKFMYITIDDYETAVYQSPDGRKGQEIKMEVILPKSLAERVFKQIKDNPKFARKIVAEIMQQRMGIPEEAWERGNESTGGIPLRPPYEKWAEKSDGAKMYIQEPEASVGIIKGFHEEWVKKV